VGALAITDYNVMMEMAGSLMAFGYYEQAGWAYSRAQMADTTNALPLLGLARSYAGLKNKDRAIDYFVKHLAKTTLTDSAKKALFEEFKTGKNEK
jgi:hypothetical protein